MADSNIPETVKSLLDIYQQPFVLVDRNYNIVAANGAYCKQYHLEPEMIVGKKCHRASHNSDHPCHEHGEDCPHQRMFASGKMEESIHIHNHADGVTECVEIRAYPIRGDSGEILYMGEQLAPIEPRKVLAEEGMIGDSPIFLEAVTEANILASVHLPLLLSGESGSGKNGFAHYIHKRTSDGSPTPFITVDCCSLNVENFETVLFGQEASSTKDGKEKVGLVEMAHGGILFFDEISEIPLEMQSRLLRVIENGQYRRIGGTTTFKSDMRIISTTNKNLQGMVETDRFRADLFFRIAGHTLEIPSLRKRKQDILQLVCHFLEKLGKNTAPSKQTMDILNDYPYPGNIRELKSIIELAALKSSDSKALEPEHLPGHIRNWKTKGNTGKPQIDQFFKEHQTVSTENNYERYTLGIDRDYVLSILTKFGGSRRKTANHLGITERKLYRLLKRYRESGITVPEKLTKNRQQTP